ncbi:MAG: M20 family metallopeptidase [Cytophagales bacterium]|nr:M20 family metallopeptidase [Cytophagales bacterium]
MKKIQLLCVLLGVCLQAASQTEINPKVKGDKDKQFLIQEIDKNAATYRRVSRNIWGYAELGFNETKSSTELQEMLKASGFKIEQGVSDMPTAFVASFGSGGPVIGILAEFDALPGLSQDSLTTKQPLIEGGAGHACGHNLFGTASSAAAIALKEWLIKNKKAGTIRVYGTPAEEGGSAKVYMVRDGLFKDVDAVLHWHPSSANDASPNSCLSIKQTLFRFHGRSSHAAAAPDAGRSALDGVESMNYMVNMMREHIPQEARIHYIISKGGLAANVVPDFAEVEYMVRHPDARVVEEIWKRIVKCSEGAAMGTETTTSYEVVSGSYNLVPNETLARVMYNNLTTVGGVTYTPKELEFAKEIQKTLSGRTPDLSQAQVVQPFKTGGFFPASTDVGDITWVVPTVGLGTATWVPGAPAHSWQAVATGGMSIGQKAMLNAAKTIALTGADLFTNPALIQKAKEELTQILGPGFQYKSMIGDRKPPLDFRKGK